MSLRILSNTVKINDEVRQIKFACASSMAGKERYEVKNIFQWYTIH